MMIHKITPSVDWSERFDTELNEQTSQNSIKVVRSSNIKKR